MQTTNSLPTILELTSLLKEGHTVTLTYRNTPHRLVLDTNGLLYILKKHSRSYGILVTDEILSKSVIFIKEKKNKIEKKENSVDDIIVELYQKYRKEVAMANFTNDYIREFLSYPETKEEWVSGGKKQMVECEWETLTVSALEKMRDMFNLTPFESLSQMIKERKTINLSLTVNSKKSYHIYLKSQENGDYDARLLLYHDSYPQKNHLETNYVLINEDKFVVVGYD